MGLPSVSLWAAVPHYLPAAPNPKAALALIERISALLSMPVQTDSMARAVESWEEGVVALLGENEELSDYVRRLEAAADDSLGPIRPGDEVVPSGDVLAAELERFLREQGGGTSDR